MAEPSPTPGERRLQDAVRSAVERTLAAAQERGRAGGELLDDVARRGHEARESVARRGQEARDASATVTSRVVEAIGELRLASADDVRALTRRIDEIERRVAALEREAST